MNTQFARQQTLSDTTLLIETGTSLDNSNAHEMVNLITSAQSRGFINVILDMAALEFLSSAGVGSILGTVEMFREQGGDIYLCNLSENIRHVLEVLDLTDYLSIPANRREAAEVCGIQEQK